MTAVADTYYRAQTATVDTVLAAIAEQWSQVTVDDLDGSWVAVRRAVAVLIASGQLRAAAVTPLVIQQVLLLAGLAAAAPVRVRPVAFAGYTSAGYKLEPVLDVSVVLTKKALLRGVSPAEALSVGRGLLTAIASTEIGDASRDAMGVAMRVEPRIAGYVRRAEPGACKRCLAQDGKFFRDNTGFPRHPHCHCVHEPVTAARSVADEVSLDGMADSGSAYSSVRRPDRLSAQRISKQARSAEEYRRLLVANGYAA